MRTIPIDSTDAAEQRELEAEEVALAVARDRQHAQQCRDGWLGEDTAGLPIPCTRCRPHLAAIPCRICLLGTGHCADQVAAGYGTCCSYCDHEPIPRQAQA